MVPHADALRGLARRFTTAQDAHPQQLGFAVAFLPFDESEADKAAQSCYGNRLTEPPHGRRYVELGGLYGEDPGEDPSPDRWDFWLLKESTETPDPDLALKQFHSLAADAVRILNLKRGSPGYFGETGGFWTHAIRWAAERLPDSHPKKQFRNEVPRDGERRTYLTPYRPESGVRHWFVEGPCVFALLAAAVETERLKIADPHLPGAVPEYMSAGDFAQYFGLPKESTRKKLERLAEETDCRREAEGGRVGDPKYIYHVPTARKEFGV